MKGYLLLIALLLGACGTNAAYVPAVVEMLTEVAKLAQQHGKALEEIPFDRSRQSASKGITKQHGMSNLFYSFGNQHPGNLGLYNYPKFLQEVSVPGHAFLDLAAVDIVRARERGVELNESRLRMANTPEGATYFKPKKAGEETYLNKSY